MMWISFVSLLVLSGVALVHSNHDSSYGQSTRIVADAQLPKAPIVIGGYGSSYGSGIQRNLIFDQPKPETLPLSEADILCKDKTEGFVIILSGGEKFVICTADSKGDEIFCPKGLLYNEESRRCERKYNPNQSPCASQPCLNNGRCIPTQYSYQCECGQGFTGRTCELDGSVCQQQQPCGTSFDSICQSFHVGSGLKHVCLLQEGRSYGLTVSQAFANPCLSGEGLHPLAFGNKGFIMCDGDQMFIQSCPGGTIWDSLTKVCVWPEMEGTILMAKVETVSGYGAQSFPVKTEESMRLSSLLPSKPVVQRPVVMFDAVPLTSERSLLPQRAILRTGGGGGGGGGGEDFSAGINAERFVAGSGRNFPTPLPVRRGENVVDDARRSRLSFTQLPGASSLGSAPQDLAETLGERATGNEISTSDSLPIPFRPSELGSSFENRPSASLSMRNIIRPPGLGSNPGLNSAPGMSARREVPSSSFLSRLGESPELGSQDKRFFNSERFSSPSSRLGLGMGL